MLSKQSIESDEKMNTKQDYSLNVVRSLTAYVATLTKYRVMLKLTLQKCLIFQTSV